MDWFTPKLHLKVKQTFERIYGRELTNLEVQDIAINLTSVSEELLKNKWKQKYG